MQYKSLEERLILQDREKKELSQKFDNLIICYRLQINSILKDQEVSWFISRIEWDENYLYFYLTNQYWTQKIFLNKKNLKDDDIVLLRSLLNSNVSIITQDWEIKWLKVNWISINDEFINDNQINLVWQDEQRRYKYIHYRQEWIFDAIKERENIIKNIRRYFENNWFIEIETPILWPVFSEYADESFLVYDEKLWWAYSLPQSPQVYKQLSILSGVQKYFQIARCFRRDADSEFKKIEFTQMDVEVANMKSKDIRLILENLIKELFKLKWINLDWNIPVFTYQEAMSKFWTEKPILEWKEYSLCWVIQSPIFEVSNWKIQPSHHIVSKPLDEDLELLEKDPLSVRWDNYDLIFNWQEVAGWDIRINDPLLQYKMLKLIWYSDEYIEKYYSWYIEALSNWCPPHGWFATWVERIVTLLNKNKDISKYIMFPKYANWEPISGFPKKM